MGRVFAALTGIVGVLTFSFQFAAGVPVGEFTILPGESRVEFFVVDNRGGFRGFTDQVRGTVLVTEDAQGNLAGWVDAVIDARRITTFLTLRDRQMHRTYLQTDRFPTITFQGTAVPIGGGGVEAIRVLVQGQLTIVGRTRPVEFSGRVWALPDRYLATGETVISLSSFQIPIPRFFIFVAEDLIKVQLRIVAVRSSTPR